MISEIRLRIAVMRLKIMQVFLGLLFGLVAFTITVYAQPEASGQSSQLAFDAATEILSFFNN